MNKQICNMESMNNVDQLYLGFLCLIMPFVLKFILSEMSITMPAFYLLISLFQCFYVFTNFLILMLQIYL